MYWYTYTFSMLTPTWTCDSWILSLRIWWIPWSPEISRLVCCIHQYVKNCMHTKNENMYNKTYAGVDKKGIELSSKTRWAKHWKFFDIPWLRIIIHSKWILNELFNHYVSITLPPGYYQIHQWSPFHALVGHGDFRCPAGFLQFESLWWGDSPGAAAPLKSKTAIDFTNFSLKM